MEQANIKDKNKVTHRGRIHGSQYAQACGASVEAIAQHGNWALNRLATHYLSRVDAGVALYMAGFNPPNERLWLLRNIMIPPVELQRLVFPFIETQFPDDDWKAWIENIMLDRDVFYGRKILPLCAKKAPPRGSCRQNASTCEDEIGASDNDNNNDNYGDDNIGSCSRNDAAIADASDSDDDEHDDGHDEDDYTIAKPLYRLSSQATCGHGYDNVPNNR
ncbi:hypothetical protein BGW39_004122 [Mortierella sp. 14UC]|nr:hypothetical protein BGW39_004122 [Mortierella sp. 14UC]